MKSHLAQEEHLSSEPINTASISSGKVMSSQVSRFYYLLRRKREVATPQSLIVSREPVKQNGSLHAVNATCLLCFEMRTSLTVAM